MPAKKPVSQRGPLSQYSGRTKASRFKIAERRVLEDGDAIATVAREMGVSRAQLNNRLRALKQKKADDLARVASSLTGFGTEAVTPEGQQGPPAVRSAVNERRRMLAFDEFDERYFGGLICPDCHKHHETPAFHKEISDAVLGDSRRLLINLPPYHSKSTLVTAKHTIYDLVQNPNNRTIIVSASQTFSRTFMHQITQWFENPDVYQGCAGNLIEDYGPFFNESSSATQTQMYVAGRTSTEKDPSIVCIGVGNQIYGRRADKVKFDDIATLDNQRNPAQVLKQLEWIDKEALSRIGRGKATWVGTRVSAGDIYSYLGLREGYKVIKYPCILDEETKATLWPEHFPYDQAVIRRGEMKPEDWQLVYQNVDTPGMGSSFPAEVIEECKDREHVLGEVEQSWKLYIGLDPAGGGKQSGFTALMLLGYDRDTQDVHLVDMINIRALKAHQLKDQILDWCNTYTIAELRVENNGIQSQLVQYNQELMLPLTQKGVRVVGHHTHQNKWDSQFGVEAMAPWFYNRKFLLPWGNPDSQRRVQVFIDQLVSFPMGDVNDTVMAAWIGWLGVKEGVARHPGPMFENRKVPGYVRRRRRIADPATGINWKPNDPRRPNFGRDSGHQPVEGVKLVNVGGSFQPF